MGTLIQIIDLPALRKKAYQDHKTIALANGCFDLIHIGHINYLKETKTIADIVVVALNSDESVVKLKGSNRLIFPQDQRAQILCAINYVDYVIIFDEPDVTAILKALKPDFHCKGSDYTVENVPEKTLSDQLNIQTKIVGGPKLYSSTELINTIRTKKQ
jgi:D-glycero-beta-D-manno-heptose 1-phosphate adenylyltransferase